MDNSRKLTTADIKPPQELTLKANSLFRLDINYDYLKTYLEKFQNSLDIDRADIDKLLALIGQKSLNTTLADDYHSFSESIQLGDKQTIQEIQDVTGSHNTMLQGQFKVQGPHEKSVIELRMKLFSNSHLLQILTTQNRKQESRITNLEQEITKKYDSKECRLKIKKIKSNFEKSLEELQNSIHSQLGETELRMSQDILKFEESIRDVERKTLWKIHDCQDLLSKRINEEFVLDVIAASEDKIIKHISMVTGGDQAAKFNQELVSLRGLVQGQNENLSEKSQKLKNQIQILNDQLKIKYLLIDKVTEQNKGFSDRIMDVNQRLQNAILRLDQSFQIDQHTNKITALEDQQQKINQENLQRMESMKDLNLNSENVAYLLSRIDPHKICSIEGDIKKLEAMSIRNTVHWETLDSEFKTKFDTINFFQQLSLANEKPQNAGVARDEVLKIINEKISSLEIDEDKYKKLQKEVADMSHKVENANEIEKRVTRIFKDLDINNIIKQLRLKANEEEVKKELFIIEQRLAQTMDTLNYLRKELESQKLKLKKSNSFNQSISPATDISVNTKKLYPVSCLSCQVVTNDSNTRTRGNDGKYYKTDLNKTMYHFDTDDQHLATNKIHTTVGTLMSKYSRPQRPFSAKK